MDDHEVVAAIAAGDPAGIAAAYDKYAVGLYGYCYWLLRRPAEAAEALRDTFAAAAIPGQLPGSARLRPWLYWVARQECQRQLQATPANGGGQSRVSDHRANMGQQDGAAARPSDAVDPPIEATQPFRVAPDLAYANHQAADATIQFRAVDRPVDETLEFRAVPQPTDATIQSRAVQQSADATIHFRAVGLPVDETLQFRAVQQPTDATLQMRVVAAPTADGDPPPPELRRLARATLAELEPGEREVIELSLRHDLYGTDLAMALGVSYGEAQALSSWVRLQLERGLGLQLAAHTGREACPALGELLADGEGQRSEPDYELLSTHIRHCVICARRRRRTLRPAALSGLPPLAPLTPGLRQQVLEFCSAATPGAVAFRRRVARRAESAPLERFSPPIKPARWDSEVASVIVVGVIWTVVAVSVALYLFIGYHPARALVPSVRTVASSPAAATTAPVPASSSASATGSASASPTPSASPPAIVTPPPVVPPPSTTVPASPSPSATPSKSPSPTPTESPSPTPTGSTTPSPTPDVSPSSSATG